MTSRILRPVQVNIHKGTTGVRTLYSNVRVHTGGRPGAPSSPVKTEITSININQQVCLQTREETIVL